MNVRVYLIAALAGLALAAFFARREYRQRHDGEQVLTAARDALAIGRESVPGSELALHAATEKRAELTRALEEARKQHAPPKPVTLAKAPSLQPPPRPPLD